MGMPLEAARRAANLAALKPKLGRINLVAT
jgi:hypothetical protein